MKNPRRKIVAHERQLGRKYSLPGHGQPFTMTGWGDGDFADVIACNADPNKNRRDVAALTRAMAKFDKARRATTTQRAADLLAR